MTCNGLDDDCHDGDCCMNDDDRDGSPCKDDCNDANPDIHPGARIPADWIGCFPSIDIDCDGVRDGDCGTI